VNIVFTLQAQNYL